ncbi:MAG: hypothetical protein LUC23_01035 [Prevotellaceae bacterium]|nr:hypothetical protein [Prevotellaceae bacterium]
MDHYAQIRDMYKKEEQSAKMRTMVYEEFLAGRLTTPSAIASMQRFISRHLGLDAQASRHFLVTTLGLEDMNNQ